MLEHITKIKEKIQYPKLLLLLFSMVFAYLLFQMDFFDEVAKTLNGKGYISVFIAGFLFSYGFTTPFAIGFFATLAPEVSVVPAALLAAVGAVISDLFIFRFMRTSFSDEMEKLKMSAVFKKISDLFHNHFREKVKKYVLWTVAGFLIASPLPDEFGVSLISGFTKINQTAFALIAFGCDFAGILIILQLAKV